MFYHSQSSSLLIVLWCAVGTLHLTSFRFTDRLVSIKRYRLVWPLDRSLVDIYFASANCVSLRCILIKLRAGEPTLSKVFDFGGMRLSIRFILKKMLCNKCQCHLVFVILIIYVSTKFHIPTFFPNKLCQIKAWNNLVQMIFNFLPFFQTKSFIFFPFQFV